MTLSATSTVKVFFGVDWGKTAPQSRAKAGKVPFKKCKLLFSTKV